MAKQKSQQHRTRLILPPAERITPAIARRWLHRRYRPLSRLGEMAMIPDWIRGVRGIGVRRQHREYLLFGMRRLSFDVRSITEACGEALATGRAVPIEWQPEQPDIMPSATRAAHRQRARHLRALILYEQGDPHRGAREVLRQALAEHERRGKARKRSKEKLR